MNKKTPKILITEEEKAWLRSFEKFNILEFEWNVLSLYFDDYYLPMSINILKHKFKGLERGREYTPEELGL